MKDVYIVLAMFAIMWIPFGIAMWLLFRPRKTDEFEDLRLAFKDLEETIAKEFEPIFRRLGEQLTRAVDRGKR